MLIDVSEDCFVRAGSAGVSHVSVSRTFQERRAHAPHHDRSIGVSQLRPSRSSPEQVAPTTHDDEK